MSIMAKFRGGMTVAENGENDKILKNFRLPRAICAKLEAQGGHGGQTMIVEEALNDLFNRRRGPTNVQAEVLQAIDSLREWMSYIELRVKRMSGEDPSDAGRKDEPGET